MYLVYFTVLLHFRGIRVYIEIYGVDSESV